MEEKLRKLEKENAILKKQLAKKDQRIEELEAYLMRAVLRIEELERRLGKDSHNSSKPPSSDGLGRKHLCNLHKILTYNVLYTSSKLVLEAASHR